jgi:Zn-dependent peptidase ImmA (M78 family)
MALYDKARELAVNGEKPLEIAASLGIILLEVPFKAIKGIALSLQGKKFIMIDSDLTEIEKQLVCGHELGHFLLHPDTNFLFVLDKTGFYSKHEYQANRFACMLMLGEEAEKYGCEIGEAAAAGRLDKMVEIIGRLAKGDDI